MGGREGGHSLVICLAQILCDPASSVDAFTCITSLDQQVKDVEPGPAISLPKTPAHSKYMG